MKFKQYWSENPETDAYGVSRNVSKYFEILVAKNKGNYDYNFIKDAENTFKLGNELLIKRLQLQPKILSQSGDILKLINPDITKAKEEIEKTQKQMAEQLFDIYKSTNAKERFSFSEQYKRLRTLEKEKNNPKSLKEIIYSGSDNSYCVKINNSVYLKKYAENIEKMDKYIERYVYPKKRSSYQAIDKNLVSFINEVFGKEKAREYVKQWERGLFASKNQLAYTINYDFSKVNNDIDEQKNIEESQKRLHKVLKRSKKLISIRDFKLNKFNKLPKGTNGKKRFLKRTVSLFFAQLLGISGAAGLLNEGSEKNENINNRNFLISDNLEYNSEDNYKIKEDKIQFIEKNTDNKKYDLGVLEKYKLSIEQIEKNVDKNDSEVKENTINKKEVDDFDIKMGSVLKLENGIKYSADSRDIQRDYKIGSLEWRPSGNYEINGVSILNKDNQIVDFSIDDDELDIKDFIEKNLENGGRISYHINYIKDGEKHPTGWVDADEIYAMLERQRKER